MTKQLRPPEALGWRLAQWMLVLVLIVGLPLVGIWSIGGDVGAFLRFPPRPIAPAPSSFTPWIFALYAVAIVLVLAPFIVRVLSANRAMRRSASHAVRPAASTRQALPYWGWWGLGLLLISWVVAWVPIPGLELARRLSFTPLWLGYTVLMSAWVLRRGGRVLLCEQPLRFIALFPASAVFWYLFEYLNQFTGNWIYAGTGVADDQALSWFIRSALPFSTVLPAVLVTRDWLATFPRLYAGLDHFVALPVQNPNRLSVLTLIVASMGLVAVARWPDGFYAVLWLAPALLIVALQGLAGQTHALSSVAQGDWRGPWLAVVAALFCGLCWELWNILSLARWTYHIPHAQVLHLFEMPLLGYAGYLPFGLTCVIAAQWLAGVAPQTRHSRGRA